MPHPLRMITDMIGHLKTLKDMQLEFEGTPPTARDIDGMLPPVWTPQLMAREVSTTLVQGDSSKGPGTYVGLMPVGSVQLGPTEKLDQLVKGLRIFFVSPEERGKFTFEELTVATPDEVREAQEEAVRAKEKRELEAELKRQLHAHYDQLYGALASLTHKPRTDYPQCGGDCSYGLCKYYGGVESFLRSCHKAGTDINSVMREIVTTAD